MGERKRIMWNETATGDVWICPMCGKEHHLIHCEADTAFVGDKQVRVRRVKHRLEEIRR